MTSVETSAGAVIFDLDGTLVDSNYLHTLAWSRALRATGEWAPMNAIHRLIGMGADQLLPRLIGREDQAVAARRDEEYQTLIGEVVAFPGAERLLRRVHELRLGVVLATIAGWVVRLCVVTIEQVVGRGGEMSPPYSKVCPTRRAPGGLEAEVLAVLAAKPRPVTSAEVLDELAQPLAYTTVMTTLARLHGKGVIARSRMGRAFAYALLDPPTVTARRMCRELDSAESREVVLARFVAELEPSDVPVLQRLLGATSDV